MLHEVVIKEYRPLLALFHFLSFLLCIRLNDINNEKRLMMKSGLQSGVLFYWELDELILIERVPKKNTKRIFSIPQQTRFYTVLP